ncbi:MAG: hypothetical protein ACJ741_15185 [Pyrinomonadaceae bacterium]
MRQFTLMLRARGVLAALAVVCLTLVGTLVWRSSARQQTQAEQSQRQLLARIRDGVGSEVHFAPAHASSATVRASVNEVAQFIHKRSGVQLGGAVRNRLAALEEETLNGTRRRISLTELSDIMSATALERLATLSDQDIARMDTTLRGFNDPNLPSSFRRGHEQILQMRAGHAQMMTSEKFIAQVKAIRNQLGTPGGEVFMGMTRRVLKEEAQKKAILFSEAVPEQFGGIWDVAHHDDGALGLTPIQSLIISYSVASDDLLTDSEANLGKRLQRIHDGIVDFDKHDYPSPNGHTAYGVNGYYFSTPLDLAFDEDTLNALLNRIAERSAS